MTRPDDPPSHPPDRVPALRALLRADLAVPLAPALLPPLVRGLNGLLVLAGLAAVVAAFWYAPWLGVLALLGLPVLVAGAIALIRVAAELALAVLSLTEDVTGIAGQLPRLESTVSDVANDMPRFGFLKRLAGPRPR